MRIFNDLLFHHGHVADAELARQLASTDRPPEGSAAGGGASHPHRHPRAEVRARQARLVRTLTALSPFR